MQVLVDGGCPVLDVVVVSAVAVVGALWNGGVETPVVAVWNVRGGRRCVAGGWTGDETRRELAVV